MADKQHPNKVFRWLIISIGAPVFCWCFNYLPADRLDLRYLLLTLTIVLTARIAVQIPSINYHITVSDTLIFLTLLLYGGYAAVLLAALDGICSSMRISKKPTTLLFNASVMSISTFATAAVVGLCFGPVLGVAPRAVSKTLISSVSLMALVQYLTNTGLIALDRSLKTGDALWQTWRKYYPLDFDNLFCRRLGSEHHRHVNNRFRLLPNCPDGANHRYRLFYLSNLLEER